VGRLDVSERVVPRSPGRLTYGAELLFFFPSSLIFLFLTSYLIRSGASLFPASGAPFRALTKPSISPQPVLIAHSISSLELSRGMFLFFFSFSVVDSKRVCSLGISSI